MADEGKLVTLLLADMKMQPDPQLVDNIGRVIDSTGRVIDSTGAAATTAIKVLAYAVAGTIVLVGTLVGIGLFVRYVILLSSLYPASKMMLIGSFCQTRQHPSFHRQLKTDGNPSRRKSTKSQEIGIKYVLYTYYVLIYGSLFLPTSSLGYALLKHDHAPA